MVRSLIMLPNYLWLSSIIASHSSTCTDAPLLEPSTALLASRVLTRQSKDSHSWALWNNLGISLVCIVRTASLTLSKSLSVDSVIVNHSTFIIPLNIVSVFTSIATKNGAWSHHALIPSVMVQPSPMVVTCNACSPQRSFTHLVLKNKLANQLIHHPILRNW